MNKQLASRIRQLRELKGLTVKQFCNKLDLPSSSISNIEVMGIISVRLLFKISEVLDMSCDEIFGRKPIKSERITLQDYLIKEREKKHYSEILQTINRPDREYQYINFYHWSRGHLPCLSDYIGICDSLGVSYDKFNKNEN